MTNCLSQEAFRNIGLEDKCSGHSHNMLILPLYNSILLKSLHTFGLVKNTFLIVEITQHKFFAIVRPYTFYLGMKLSLHSGNKVLNELLFVTSVS